jgi:hypothetical protein
MAAAFQLLGLLRTIQACMRCVRVRTSARLIALEHTTEHRIESDV